MFHGTNISERDIDLVFDYAYRYKGVNLEAYRRSFIARRLNSRMQSVKAATALEYIRILRNNPDEFSCFIAALSINVTEFFRDPEVFDEFQRVCLPDLARRKRSEGWKLLRIWSAGCASGEEAYSIAIAANETVCASGDMDVVIQATDIDGAALARAKKGEYGRSALKKVNKKTLEKYFMPVYNGAYLLKEEIKNKVRFQQRDLITSPALKHTDVVFCRNMMIYLSKEEKVELIGKFRESLNMGGYLVVGKVESVWNKEGFEIVSVRNKIYRKIG